jgi:monovalent cation:H+ antiporter-2, CPA2 family
MHSSALVLQICIIVGAATAVATLCHALKIPTVVGFLFAGTLIGPWGSKLVQSVPGAEMATELGGTLLLFTVGLEFSFRKLRQSQRLFLGLGSVQVLGTTIVIAALCMILFSWPWPKAVFMGFLISLSSTALVLKLLEEGRELQTPYGNCTLGILLFQDVAFIPMAMLIPLLAVGIQTETGNASLSSTWMVEASIVFVGVLLASRYLVPKLLEAVVKSGNREIFFFCVLFLIFGTGFALESIGLSLGLGAFIAGMLLCDSPYGKQATADIVPFRDTFLGIFFLSVGMLLNLPFLWDNLGSLMLMGLGCLIIKVAIATIAVRLQKFPFSLAIMVGVAVSQVGEFSFLLATLGHRAGIITENELQYFLCLSVLSLVVSPFVQKVAKNSDWRRQGGLSVFFKLNSKQSPLRKEVATHLQKSESTKGAHTVVIGFGWAGQNLAGALKVLQVPYKILEMNFSQVQKFKHAGEPIYWGDATRVEVLEQVHIHSARLVVISVTGAETTRRIVETIRRVRPEIPVIVRIQYLRELEQFRPDAASDLVIAEFETTIEILARALKTYGVSSRQLHEFIDEAHKQLNRSNTSFSDSLRRTVELPGWETLSLIRPLTLDVGSLACGKSVAEINLRAQSGALIVSVFRKGLGTTVPHAEFVLQGGDVLHLIGENAQLDLAEALLAAPVVA